MRTLILYATKTGAARECAKLLGHQFHCSIQNIEESVPDLAKYDIIILGTGVRMGNIYKNTEIRLDEF